MGTLGTHEQIEDFRQVPGVTGGMVVMAMCWRGAKGSDCGAET